MLSVVAIMSTFQLQKRLPASVLKCGKKKVWLDPNETNEIANANSRQNIRKLVKDGLIIKKPQIVHSRTRVREADEARLASTISPQLWFLVVTWPKYSVLCACCPTPLPLPRRGPDWTTSLT